jgi:hypothetical protein
MKEPSIHASMSTINVAICDRLADVHLTAMASASGGGPGWSLAGPGRARGLT